MVENQWKSKTFKVLARDEKWLDVVEQLLLHMEYLGKIGASRNLLVRVDGDGSGQILIEDEDGLFISDYKNLKTETPTDQATLETTISGVYDIG